MRPKTKERDRILSSAVEENQTRLRSFVGSRIQDRIEAEDIVQDTFAEFFESYDLNVAIEKLGSWLFRVAQNKIVDRFRKRKTEDNYAKSFFEELPATNPERDLSNTFLRESILAALELLSKEQRDVFVMNELEGKSFEQISKETGVNLNTLLARKRCATGFLREYLKEVFDEYS
jgi:RNA polymerase sigma factor (sigma-70 family)